MDGVTNRATPEEDRLLTATFLRNAMENILAPTVVNKFALSNAQNGAPVLVFGTAALVEIAGFLPRGPYATIACAITFDKRLAEDIVVNLQQTFGITEDDMSAAIQRSIPAASDEKN